MAIFHLSAKAISRSAGRSATGAIAYRSAEKIVDRRTGLVFDYTKKVGVDKTLDSVFLPGGKKTDRAEFWNEVELHHKRGDAVLLREVEVSLPVELSSEKSRELAVQFAKSLGKKYGVGVDVSIHTADKKNPHAHISLSACAVSQDGKLGKKVNALDPIHCQRTKEPNLAEFSRPEWADRCNQALAMAGHHTIKIDHRSLADQGIDREPTVHRGPAVDGMEKRGVDSEVGQRITQQAEAKAAEKAETYLTALENAHHQEQRRARTQEPSILADMPNLHGVDNVFDIRGTENVLQPDAPDHIRPDQAAAGHPDLHKLDAARAVRAIEQEQEAQRLAEQQAAQQQEQQHGIEIFERIGKHGIDTSHALTTSGDALRASSNHITDARRDFEGAKKGAERRVFNLHLGKSLAAVAGGLEKTQRGLRTLGRVVQQITERIEYVVRPILNAITRQQTILAEQQRQAVVERALTPPRPKSYYHPDNVAKREAQALQESQQKAADAEQWQARIKKLSEQGKIMEYTRRIEVELQAKNAKAAAELRDKADLLAEQVASGEKSSALLKTANEHVRNAELLERIAAKPLLHRPVEASVDSLQEIAMRLAEHFKKLIDWIKSIGGEHQKIPVEAKSEWEGRFVKVDDQFAVQNVGKKHVIHILDNLDKKPLEGSKGNVLYGFDGKAKVTIQPDLNPVKGKGGIAD